MNSLFLVLAVLLCLRCSTVQSAEPVAVSGEATIRAPAAGSEIVITTTSRLAGAVHSLRWGGREFIDSFDHGRQLQSAANFDAMSPLTGETFNPTEAGSRRDGRGGHSSSRLLHLVAAEGALQTTSRMAFWLAPGEKSGPNLAKNTTVLSNHLLTKRIRIGYGRLDNVVQYDVTFGVPVGERHTQAVFEVVTGYLPAEFERFWQFDPSGGRLEPLSDGPGEQQRPVVLATPDGRYAMGVYTPQHPSAGWSGPGYGRFRFQAERVVKWNCVFRFRDADGVPAADYRFHAFVVVGSLDQVRDSLEKLHRQPVRPLATP